MRKDDLATATNWDTGAIEARIVELEAAVAALQQLIEANTRRIAELEDQRNAT